MALRCTKLLSRFLDTLPEGSDKAALLRLLDTRIQELRGLEPGPDRARRVHARVDHAIESFRLVRPMAMAAVRCAKGCSHCCRVRVSITQDEADLLWAWVQDHHVPLDRGRLEHQRSWTTRDFDGQPLADAQCVFLNDQGACGVYEVRPSACRLTLVTTDPERCRRATGEAQVQVVVNPFAEVEASAALTVDAQASGNLPEEGRSLAQGLLEAYEAQSPAR